MSHINSSVGKGSACNAGDMGDAGLIPGSRRSLAEENGNHSSTLAWEIPWTEAPGRLQSWTPLSEHTHTLSEALLVLDCSQGDSVIENQT